MQLKIGLLVAVTCLGFSAPGFTQDKVAPGEDIVIGATLAFGGTPGLLGAASMVGLRMSEQIINDAGGIKGRKLRMVIEDDNYVPARSVQNLQKLIDVDNLFAFIPTAGGAQVSAMLPLIDEKAILTFDTAVTTEAHFKPAHPMLFGIGMTYDLGAYELVKFIGKKYPNSKWAIIVQNDESGLPREVGYTRALKEIGQESVSMQRFKRGQVDFSSEMQRVKAAGATAIILGGLPSDNAAMAKEAKKLGLDLKMGADWINHIPPMIDLVGPAGDGMFVVDFLPALTDKSLEPFMALVDKYIPKADQAKVNRYTLLSYENTMLFAEAARSCGTDLTRKCVVSYLDGLKDYQTKYIGKISFPKGQRLSTVNGYLLKIDAVNKKFVAAQ